MNCLNHEQINAMLSGNAPLAWLAHTADCDACAQALAHATEQLPSVSPPPGLPAQITARARQIQQQESLRSYALRVVAAVAAVLILLFSGVFNHLASLSDHLPQVQAAIASFTTEFLDFTTQEDPPNAPTTQ